MPPARYVFCVKIGCTACAEAAKKKCRKFLLRHLFVLRWYLYYHLGVVDFTYYSFTICFLSCRHHRFNCLWQRRHRNNNNYYCVCLGLLYVMLEIKREFFTRKKPTNNNKHTHTHYIDTICINYQVGVFFSLSSIIEHTI